jgi:superfamily I DNA/RNA helicase
VVELTDYDGRPTDAVKVGTIKRAKGLEFKQVLLPWIAERLMSPASPERGGPIPRSNATNATAANCSWVSPELATACGSAASRRRDHLRERPGEPDENAAEQSRRRWDPEGAIALTAVTVSAASVVVAQNGNQQVEHPSIREQHR